MVVSLGVLAISPRLVLAASSNFSRSFAYIFCRLSRLLLLLFAQLANSFIGIHSCHSLLSLSLSLAWPLAWKVIHVPFPLLFLCLFYPFRPVWGVTGPETGR